MIYMYQMTLVQALYFHMIVVSDEIDINTLGDLQLELDESFHSWLESEELTEHYQDWLNRTQFQDDREY